MLCIIFYVFPALPDLIYLWGNRNTHMHRLFQYRSSPVSYHRFGEGKDLLLAFHGYDQTGAAFLCFEETLGKYFTVIAIDFFWHGRSEWNEEGDFTVQHLQALVSGILQQEELTQERFSVCAYSMGARMARSMASAFPGRVEHVLFLSPPSFVFNRFLDLATNSWLGLRLFRHFVRRNDHLLSVLNTLHWLRLLNRTVYLFSHRFVEQQVRMEKVYRSWYAQRKLQSGAQTFARLAAQYEMRITLIAGVQDAITPARTISRYVRSFPHHRVYLVKKGHELHSPETQRILSTLFGQA